MKSGPVSQIIPATTYLLFGGKGGVGKTTCAVSTALLLLDSAKSGEKILLFSTDPAHSLADSLNFKGSSQVFRVAEHQGAVLDAWEMDSGAALEAFKARHREILAEIADRGTILDEADINELLNLSLPGMDEIMALFELSELDSRGEYTRVIVDTAPSGHTSRLLELPDVFTRWIAALDRMSDKHRFMVSQIARTRGREDAADAFLSDLSRRVRRVREILYSSKNASFVLVTIPEAMAVDETVRFFDVLRKDGIPVTHVITNRIEQPHGNCPYCAARVTSQKSYLKRIRAEFKNVVHRQMPVMPDEVRGLESLREFAKTLWVGAGFTPARPNAVRREAIFDRRAGVKPPPTSPIDARKVIIVGGKGGVGKTTTAAAIALQLATGNPGGRILVFSADPAHSLSDSFDEKIGEFKSGVAGQANLDGVEINALAKFDALKLRYRKWVDEIFASITGDSNWQIQYDREAMHELISLAPPGIDEIAALSAISDFLEKGTYIAVVLDTAPTGHLLRFLELPGIALQWVRTFLRLLLKYREFVTSSEVAEELIKLSKDIKRVIAILNNPADCEFIAVSIAERMSLNETSRLIDGIEKLHVSFKYAIVNNVIPEVAAQSCDFCSGRRASQRRQIDAFRKSVGAKAGFIIAPQHPHDIRGEEQLKQYLISWTTTRAAKGHA